MARKMSKKQLSDAVSQSLRGFHLADAGAQDAPRKRAVRKTVVKTRTVQPAAGTRKTAARSRGVAADRVTDPLDDEIVLVESDQIAGADAHPLRKAAVVSGKERKVIGMQG